MIFNLREVLEKATAEKRGVGMYNIADYEQARGIIAAAEETGCPAIFGTAEVLETAFPITDLIRIIKPMAENASVPVVLHYDHSMSFDSCVKALGLGFTSVMYDCSGLDYEENVKELAAIVRVAHALGASVEGELGHVGDNEGADALEDPSAYYTDPDVAADYVKRTGVDALAIAVGTAHGDYKFTPKLDFDRIVAIKEKTGIPLVLHGGSGLPEEEIVHAIECGISKINIFTDLDHASARGVRRMFEEGKDSMYLASPYQVEEVKNCVAEKMKLFYRI